MGNHKPKAYLYAEKVLAGIIQAPIQVRKACGNFLHEYDTLQHQNDFRFKWSRKLEGVLDEILKMLNFAEGLKQNECVYDNLLLWQWFAIQNIFVWVEKADEQRRRIQRAVLCIAKKSGKTFICSLVNIISFFLSPDNANFFSASNTGQQAKLLVEQAGKIIKASPDLLPHFTVMERYIRFEPKNVKLEYMNGDANTAHGRIITVGVLDEVGADSLMEKMCEAVESSQYNVKNKLSLKISTAYGIVNGYNYFKSECDKVYRNTFGETDNQRLFGLLYYIDNPNSKEIVDGVEMERWENSANWCESCPLLAEFPSELEGLINDYKVKKGTTAEFDFKVLNLNLWLAENYQGENMFTEESELEKGRCAEIQDLEWWRDKKQVFFGVDLAREGTDNSAVCLLWYDHKEKIYYTKHFVFYPSAKEQEKTKNEGLPYRDFASKQYCYPCGHKTVDYQYIEDFIANLVQDYNLEVGSIAFDKTFAGDMMKNLAERVYQEEPSVEVRQGAHNLGATVVEIQRAILEGRFLYAPNPLMRASFLNGVIKMIGGRPWVEKVDPRRTKIDSLVATFNAVKMAMYFREEDKFIDDEQVYIGVV
ncbi:terminase TerL endonuclease subunit [Priestia megaterium]|uniref:terminase TerL endonuclease subunit n=1 Tax=Priestia megaterium TaxID=1404 RepID=UPI002E1D2DAB|nr:terminase TerL endonuclease subunit [Priestia megaterium]MED4267343.1 terminase large subunit [Priestia megaterium]MED4278304.1 terminase large subunit [Priestia megaterium]MED4314409.1 terminase large subunit [Priestia megaterium]